MSWEEGIQKYEKDDVNERIANTKGFIEEKQAKLLLYEFLRENTTFAVDLLSGVKLFPFQHMAIKSMFKTDYFLGVWCLDQNEYVLTKSGFKKIKNIEVGDQVRSRKKLNSVSDKWTNKEEDGLFISTQSGDSFKAKIGHKTLVYDTKGEWETNYLNPKTTDFINNNRVANEVSYIPLEFGKKLL